MAESLSSVSGALVAKCCGISRRHHTNLVKAGALPGPDEAHRYDLAASVRAYIAHRSDAPSSMSDEKLRLIAERRRKLEIDNAIKEQAFIPADLVAQEFLALNTVFVESLKALPSRATALGAMKSAHELRAILLEEVRHVREAVAALSEKRADALDRQAAKAERANAR